VHIAFLHRKLEENVYMEIPEGLNVERNIFVCKLNKSLGLNKRLNVGTKHL